MRRSLWIVCVLVSIALPMLASAGEWHRVDSAPSSAEPAEIVVTWLASPQSAALELDGLELEVARVLPAGRAASTVRLEQTHRGLPVLGASAAIVVASDGRIVSANLDVARKLDVEPTPTVTLEQALEVVATTGAPLNLPMHDGARGTLAVLPDAGDHGTLVWDIVVPTLDGGWNYRVAANTADPVLLGAHPMARHANGRVYPISGTVTPTVEDLELPALDTTDPQVLRGWGARFDVTNYVSGDPQQGDLMVEQTVQADANGDFLFDPPANTNDATDPFAQVSTYYHLSRMRQYFVDQHGIDTSGAEWKLTAVANLTQNGQPLDNAYYSPQGIGGDFASPNMIGIGQGTIDFAYDSDVIMHEFTHYMTGVAVGYNQGQFYANDWGLQTAGGSIDEGVSDYFAATVNGDPVVSEMALGALGASRNLETTNRVCPDDVFGEVHADGEIIGAYSWLVRQWAQNHGLDILIADQIIWGGITQLTADATLGDLPRGAAVVAETLLLEGALTTEQYDTLVALAAERGLDQCDQSLPLDATDPHRVTLIGFDFLAAAFGATCSQIQGFGFKLQSPFHFHADPPANALGVRFKVTMNPTTPGDLSYELLGRAGEHVGFTPSNFGASPSTFDYRRANQSAETSELVIDASSTPPFDPSTSYHFVVMQANCPTTFADVSVEYILEPVLEDVADTADVADMASDTSVADTGPSGDTEPAGDTATGEDTTADTSAADTSTGGDAGAELVEEEKAGSSDDCACQVRAGSDAGDGAPRSLLFGALAALLGLVGLRRRRR